MSYLVTNPEDRFSRDEVHIRMEYGIKDRVLQSRDVDRLKQNKAEVGRYH